MGEFLARWCRACAACALLTALALLQATRSAKELKIESLESELKGLRTVDLGAERRRQMRPKTLATLKS